MSNFLAALALTVIAFGKISLFVISVRNAIRPRPLPIPEEPIDPDGPDDGWRWWEEFEPEPEPQEPSGGPAVKPASSTADQPPSSLAISR